MFQFLTQRPSIIVISYDTQILTRKGNALHSFWHIKFRVFDYSHVLFRICIQYANFPQVTLGHYFDILCAG